MGSGRLGGLKPEADKVTGFISDIFPQKRNERRPAAEIEGQAA